VLPCCLAGFPSKDEEECLRVEWTVPTFENNLVM
jgi:hypothetical protein